jgi:hypothetical protein
VVSSVRRPGRDGAPAALALTHLIATTVLPSDTRLWPPLFDTVAALDRSTAAIEAMIQDARGARRSTSNR